jgi:hypothetical protein
VTAVTWSNSQGGGGTAGGTTSWSVPGVTLVPGVNVITVLARDAAGNTGRTQLSITATDTRAPVVTILSNGPSTTAGAIQLSGTASDDFGLASLSWRNGRGGSGMATGTTSWIAAVVPVQPGSNDITVTATDKAGNSATSVLKINSNKVKDPAPATSTMTSDLTTSTSALTPIAGAPVYPSTPASRIMPAQSLRPALSIEPTVINGPWVTSSSTVPLKGTATDNVTRVTWSVDWGGSGTASGTREWTVPTVGLQIGRNVITVTAMTADGRVDRQSVTVTYQPLRASR